MGSLSGEGKLHFLEVAMPINPQILRSLDEACARALCDRTQLPQQTERISGLLDQLWEDLGEELFWLEATLWKALTESEGSFSLCLLKAPHRNRYRLCLAQDVDQHIYQLNQQSGEPVELVAVMNWDTLNDASMSPLILDWSLDSRWFALSSRQLHHIMDVFERHRE
ncbi:hypothetical protein OPW07_00685 [Vibrio europaeus]|uniref:hypothetical protein n=2 Tax=Vibrio europaeus TaxID=300876 RepID=UPI00233E5ED3|nr:hypothetical protein [Vibrio europaeus]MDC5808240.1 hypothetical protein [Vibrio europaeus]